MGTTRKPPRAPSTIMKGTVGVMSRRKFMPITSTPMATPKGITKVA